MKAKNRNKGLGPRVDGSKQETPMPQRNNGGPAGHPTQPAQESWADVARRSVTATTAKDAKGKGKGSKGGKQGKGKGPSTSSADNRSAEAPNPAPPEARLELLPSAWKQGDRAAYNATKVDLEKGVSPKAKIITCQNLGQIRDLQRLAKLHAVSEATAVALVWVTSKLDKEQPTGAEAFFLPTLQGGGVGLARFWVFPLVSKLPALPKQPVKIKTASGPAGDLELITFRATLVFRIVSKDRWETTKRSPPVAMKRLFGEKLHSSFGWRELRIQGRTGEEEVVLQGFVRLGKTHSSAILEHDGQQGLFFQQVGEATHQKRPVCWEPVKENENAVAYYARVCADAAREGVTVAYRPGGGAFLGLRLSPEKLKPQLHAWTLTNAPRPWYAQDVLDCLQRAGCKDVTVLRPPGKRQKGWLVKAIVPDPDRLGFMAINDENVKDSILLLTMVKTRGAKDPVVVSHIKTPLKVASARGDPVASAPEPATRKSTLLVTLSLTMPSMKSVKGPRGEDKRSRHPKWQRPIPGRNWRAEAKGHAATHVLLPPWPSTGAKPLSLSKTAC